MIVADWSRVGVVCDGNSARFAEIGPREVILPDRRNLSRWPNGQILRARVIFGRERPGAAASDFLESEKYGQMAIFTNWRPHATLSHSI